MYHQFSGIRPDGPGLPIFKFCRRDDVPDIFLTFEFQKDRSSVWAVGRGVEISLLPLKGALLIQQLACCYRTRRDTEKTVNDLRTFKSDQYLLCASRDFYAIPLCTTGKIWRNYRGSSFCMECFSSCPFVVFCYCAVEFRRKVEYITYSISQTIVERAVSLHYLIYRRLLRKRWKHIPPTAVISGVRNLQQIFSHGLIRYPIICSMLS